MQRSALRPSRYATRHARRFDVIRAAVLAERLAAAAPLGVTLGVDGSPGSFRLWAPCAASVVLQIVASPEGGFAPTPLGSYDTAPAPEGTYCVTLARETGGDIWACALPGLFADGVAYRLAISTPTGEVLYRRDPHARAADFGSAWCFAVDDSTFSWSDAADNWRHPEAADLLIYEAHVGSWTTEGVHSTKSGNLSNSRFKGRCKPPRPSCHISWNLALQQYSSCR